MKKFNLSIFILFFFLALIASLLISYKLFIVNKITDNQLPVIKIGHNEVQVEIAQTEQQRQQGLSNRQSLPENQGMLFVYDQPKQASFWMKDMNFGLDFVWIREGVVVEIDKNILPENYQPPQTIQPEQEVDMVLEINSGLADRLNIQVGDKVEF